jgi:hypothetical protein
LENWLATTARAATQWLDGVAILGLEDDGGFMTGFEGPALAAGGGRLLGGLAAPAARALARRLAFRRTVSRRVRKRVDWPCSWRGYRAWLKTITADELASPVEEIHGPLAARLDEILLAKSKQWASTHDHLSRALRLVELSYPAIAATLGDHDRLALSEGWAQQRNVTVRDLLLQMAGPNAALSADDLAMIFTRRSRARRAVRLQVFDLDEAALALYLDQIQIPDVPRGSVKVLLGDFGSGKSETAEAWHRTALADLAGDDEAPLPVWLIARDIGAQSLEDAIERQVGPSWRRGRGASIAVDGLDETDPATAQTLLEAARTAAATHANTCFLLTARPGILSPTTSEEELAHLLTEEEALELVQLAGGKPHDTWQWTPAMRATVTRPFFALAAGVMLGREEAARGEADLIRGLVENALAQGKERSALTVAETRSVLEKLAVALTASGRDELTFGDRQVARSSRLVADGADGSVRFSLPIFQHWFAAQALLAGRVATSDVAADAPSFNRWRWAAAVAALSARDAGTADALLGTWVAGNPGAAAWIIKAAFGGNRDWRTNGDEALDANTAGIRVLHALRTWADALGPFAFGVLPSPVVDGPVALGVTVSGHRIDVAFSTATPAVDSVTEVPPGVHPLIPVPIVPAPEWLPWLSGVAPRGDAWPWTLVRSRVASATLKKLANDPFLGAPDGVWVQERRFDLARRLTSTGSLFYGELSAEDVRTRAADAFDVLDRNRTGGIRFGGSSPTYAGGEIEDLITWIDSSGSPKLVSYLPDCDVPTPRGGWVWDFFSPSRLQEFEAEVYGRACEAYDEALAHSMQRLGWSMPGSAVAPFGVIAEINFDAAAGPGAAPTMYVVRVPMGLMPQLARTDSSAVWSTSGRAVMTEEKLPEERSASERYHAVLETVRSWLAEQNREPGGLSWSNTIVDDMAKVRPASNVAAQWLWSDLKSLGLGDGTFPQLR